MCCYPNANGPAMRGPAQTLQTSPQPLHCGCGGLLSGLAGGWFIVGEMSLLVGGGQG